MSTESKRARKFTYDLNDSSNGRREIQGLDEDKSSPGGEDGRQKAEDRGGSFHVECKIYLFDKIVDLYIKLLSRFLFLVLVFCLRSPST